MRLGIRAKLFLVSVILIVVVGGASGGYLEFELRALLETRVEGEVRRLTHMAGESVRSAGPASVRDIAKADALADRLGRVSGARVMLMTREGVLIGDSRREPAALAKLRAEGRTFVSESGDDDRDRPSTQRERLHRRRMTSTTMVEWQGVDGAVGGSAAGGSAAEAPSSVTVRLALPLADITDIVRKLRFMIVGAGLVGLAIAILMSGLASHMISNALWQLVDKTRALAHGASRRLDVESRDEIGHLAGSINKMAADLERTVTALAAERDRFETALKGMSEALFAIDDQQVVTVVNPAMRELLGPTRLAEGLRLAEVARVPALLELIREAKDGPASAEFTIPNEVERRVLARATPLRASGGMVVVMLDVTEMRRLERIRKDFVANVSHELRTPVSIIRANAETLLGGALEDPERARGFVEAQLRSVERLTSLVADLLDLARIEAGKFRLQIETLPLLPALENAKDAVQALAKKKNLEIEIEIDVEPSADQASADEPSADEPSADEPSADEPSADEPSADWVASERREGARSEEGTEALAELWVEADPKALDQVLLNLVDNAAKYAPAGGRIFLRARSLARLPGGGPSRVRIEVEDDGPGIEPRHRARVFERFYRIDPGRSRDFGGTGLGLAIVKHLAESMNGQVGVDQAMPRGSVFWVTLPGAAGVAGVAETSIRQVA
ncbi:MAG: HAMP domain-containing protein [Deltaproteobacteria bacterium]|nr:HAMP domain-containing protein [Deltaproteobacteria bacterium]